jgi:hypothetical protein
MFARHWLFIFFIILNDMYRSSGLALQTPDRLLLWLGFQR